MIAIIALSPLISLLVAVLVALIVLFCIGLFISDAKILTVIRLIVGVIVVIYGLQLFGIAA